MSRASLILGSCLVLVGCVRREAQVGSRCPEGVGRCLETPVAGPVAPVAIVDGGVAPVVGNPECVGDCGVHGEGVGTRKSSRCVPGRYSGDFYIPEYHPSASGLCGLTTLYGGQGLGAWEFVIPPGAADAGTMQVQTCLDVELLEDAQGAGQASPSPLRTSMTATLDCETGELRGEMRGAYYSSSICDLGTVEAWYPIKGFLDAVFDPALQAFENGVVDVHEPASLLPLGSPAPGGIGTWSATRTDEMQGSPPVTDCLQGVEFTDFEVLP